MAAFRATLASGNAVRRIEYDPYAERDQQFKVTCHCGWNVTGTKDEVVTETQAHVLKVHWTEADEEDILEIATPVP